MKVRTINGLDELNRLVGEELGVSDWLKIDQAEVDTFATTTGDEYWIHTDPERARRESPYGGTILHGLFTLSLGVGLGREIYAIEGFGVGVNYGYQKVRFPAPVPVGSAVRMRATLAAVDEVAGGVQVTVTQTFECEGSEKPSCVAESVVRLFAAESP
jgi:acyl dehydratase